MRSLGNLLVIRNPKSLAYSALTLGALGAGAGYIVAPAATLSSVFSYVSSPDSLLLWRMVGSALFLPTWTYSLKVHSA
jgi:hypothetical protein